MSWSHNHQFIFWLRVVASFVEMIGSKKRKHEKEEESESLSPEGRSLKVICFIYILSWRTLLWSVSLSIYICVHPSVFLDIVSYNFPCLEKNWPRSIKILISRSKLVNSCHFQNILLQKNFKLEKKNNDIAMKSTVDKFWPQLFSYLNILKVNKD